MHHSWSIIIIILLLFLLLLFLLKEVFVKMFAKMFALFMMWPIIQTCYCYFIYLNINLIISESKHWMYLIFIAHIV